MTSSQIMLGNNIDTLKTLPDNFINCCITSPPYYGLRDYGIDNQIGMEKTPEEYIQRLVCVFREVKRILRDDGTLWVNIGDSYAGSGKGGQEDVIKGKKSGRRPEYPQIGKSARKNAVTKYSGDPRVPNGTKPKDLIGIPWLLAFALREDGWYLRQDIIWHKPNAMPESVTDRCTRSHEYIFLLSKAKQYYFNSEIIKEPATTNDDNIRDRDTGRLNNTPGMARMNGLTTNNYEKRNKRDVWTVNTKPHKDAHFAIFPERLILPCILSGCPENGIVLDPFLGSGTTALVAMKNHRKYIGCEINPDYVKIAEERIAGNKGLFDE